MILKYVGISFLSSSSYLLAPIESISILSDDVDDELYGWNNKYTVLLYSSRMVFFSFANRVSVHKNVLCGFCCCAGYFAVFNSMSQIFRLLNTHSSSYIVLSMFFCVSPRPFCTIDAVADCG